MVGFKKVYKISIDSEESVTPEETLMDSGSRYSDMERPMTDFIFRFTFTGFCICVGAILIFTFKIGVWDNGYFSILALRNRSVNFDLPAPRGIIFDHLGKPLVKNIPSFDLLVVSRELKNNSPETDTSIGKIAGILRLPADSFRSSILDNSKNNSMFFAALDLSKDKALAIKYQNLAGFYLIATTKRYYIDGGKFSQIVGYIGKVNKTDLEDIYYSPTDTIGRLGLEAQYENQLRGEHGSILFVKDSSGNTGSDPVIGNSIVSTVDFDLQSELHDEIFKILREANLPRAAAIIQNPQTGAVLAMVSFPTFDNNVFTSDLSESDYKRLFENRSQPLFNRIISGLYNPGSTIKPFMGMTALQEKVVTPNDTIKDCVSLTVPNQFGNATSYTFKNWRADYGLFNLKRSIANSCNIYFFTIGGGFGNIKGLGIDRIDKYLKNGFADSKLSIDLPGEEKGFIPTPDWKLKTKGENWYLGDTYNTSIGQGDLLVTPLWLSGYISAIANGGTFYQPKTVAKIMDNSGNTTDTIDSKELGKLPFDLQIISEMKNDMRETVLSGTAQLLNDLPVKAAAKTGTAEVVKGKSINSLFTAFAPLDNPEIEITVLVEGSASNQGYAIRIANNVLKWYFTKGSDVTLPTPSLIVSPAAVVPNPASASR